MVCGHDVAQFVVIEVRDDDAHGLLYIIHPVLKTDVEPVSELRRVRTAQQSSEVPLVGNAEQSSMIHPQNSAIQPAYSRF